MKKQCTLLVLGLILGACQVIPLVNRTEVNEKDQQISSAPLELSESLEADDWMDFGTFEANLIPSAISVLDEMESAPYYKLQFQLDSELQSVKGIVEVRYTNQSPDVLDYLVFQLFPFVYGGTVELGEILVNQQPAQLNMKENVPVVHVIVEGGLVPGDSCVVSIPFESSIPREMGGNYGLYGYFDEIVVLDGFYPMLALYDDGEWHINITSHNGDIKYEEMSFYEVTAQVPVDMATITTGQIIDEQINGNMNTIQYIAGPVREFYFAGSEHFVSIEEQIGDTLLISSGVEGNEDAIQYALDIGKASMEIFSDHFVPYPYAELDVVGTPMMALGMEYPGVSTITNNLYDLNGAAYGTPNRIYLDSVIAHEMGHQWFFNLVGSDQIEEPWLDESITQYLVRLFYEDYYGQTAADSYRESWDGRWARVDYAEIPIGKPSYEYDSSEYSPIVYGRGPYFIEALEAEMGDEVFAKALRHYVETYAWEITNAEEFKASMESACDCDLTNLFNEWVTP